MTPDEIEVKFTILRGGEEIGFGGCLGDTVDQASEGAAALIQRRQWECEPGMPDPEECP